MEGYLASEPKEALFSISGFGVDFFLFLLDAHNAIRCIVKAYKAKPTDAEMDEVLDIVQSNDVVLESFVSYWFNILVNDLNYIIHHCPPPPPI